MFDQVITVFGIQMNLWAQICGFLMLVFLVLGYMTKDRAFFVLTLIGSVFCIFESLILRVWSSAISVFLVCIRNVLIIHFEKRGKPLPKAVPIAILSAVTITGIVSIFTEKTAWALVPPVLTFTDCFFSMLRPQKQLKISVCFTAFGYIIFNYNAGAYVGAIRQVIAFIFSILGLIKFLKQQKITEANVENNLEREQGNR